MTEHEYLEYHENGKYVQYFKLSPSEAEGILVKEILDYTRMARM